jgi:fused signal recognition particle receptor
MMGCDEPRRSRWDLGMGWFQRLSKGLTKSREVLRGSIDRLFGRTPDPAMLEEFESALIGADLGARVVERVMERLKRQVQGTDANEPGQLQGQLRQTLLDVFTPLPTSSVDDLIAKGPKPFVILAIGVNGVGKTTTLAKLAQRLIQAGKVPLLVAADTFRAAAIDQLQVWADRIGVGLIRHRHGADPAAVVFDGLAAAKARKVDVLLIDTAGRLHTKSNLMDELRKMKRVLEQALPGAPHEVLLVLDATVGQNALSQARQFQQAVGVTGLALTKLDGTARGGIVVAIADELKIPVRLIGVGESVDDLQDFQSSAFVDALLGLSA